ncbi:hypothetical protein C8Q79DRAFT_1001963 [Trametes meyenii]|nr:hypothetical protein C8Q79DRAFT_1001963 [Trametes meyenii]
MFSLIPFVVSALALVSNVAADNIPKGSAAHFFSSRNSSLVFAPQSNTSGASLVSANPGDGSSNDLTALFVVEGTGVSTQILHGGLCISANGVVPGTATQTLFVADCDATDEKQLWTVNAEPATVSNADGNCITLGRAAKGVEVTLAACTTELQHLQLWNPKPVSA